MEFLKYDYKLSQLKKQRIASNNKYQNKIENYKYYHEKKVEENEMQTEKDSKYITMICETYSDIHAVNLLRLKRRYDESQHGAFGIIPMVPEIRYKDKATGKIYIVDDDVCNKTYGKVLRIE